MPHAGFPFCLHRVLFARRDVPTFRARAGKLLPSSGTQYSSRRCGHVGEKRRDRVPRKRAGTNRKARGELCGNACKQLHDFVMYIGPKRKHSRNFKACGHFARFPPPPSSISIHRRYIYKVVSKTPRHAHKSGVSRLVFVSPRGGISRSRRIQS